MPVSPSSAPSHARSRTATLWARCATIFRLGIKELWSLWRDPMMLVLIVYTTTLAVYSAGKAQPETLNHVPIAIVDEDVSTLSQRIATAFFAPQFVGPDLIAPQDVDLAWTPAATRWCCTYRPTSSAMCWQARCRACSSTWTPRA